jgi:hypothetical protein
MPPAGFEPPIPAGERLQTHPLDLSAAGIGSVIYWKMVFLLTVNNNNNYNNDNFFFTG